MPPEPRRSDATRAAILEAAQEHFASVGYEKATIRAIAGTAGIDPSLVMRYYGNKGKLFAAAANFDLCLPELSAVSHEELGTVIVQHFLERWEVDDTMVALLRAAVSNEEARLRMVEIFTDQSLPAFEELLTDHAAERAALIGGQMIGFAVCRYILRLSPVIEMTHQDIVNWMAPIVPTPLRPSGPSGPNLQRPMLVDQREIDGAHRHEDRGPDQQTHRVHRERLTQQDGNDTGDQRAAHMPASRLIELCDGAGHQE